MEGWKERGNAGRGPFQGSPPAGGRGQDASGTTGLLPWLEEPAAHRPKAAPTPALPLLEHSQVIFNFYFISN